jgi:hypothetical protein
MTKVAMTSKSCRMQLMLHFICNSLYNIKNTRVKWLGYLCLEANSASVFNGGIIIKCILKVEVLTDCT